MKKAFIVIVLETLRCQAPFFHVCPSQLNRCGFCLHVTCKKFHTPVLCSQGSKKMSVRATGRLIGDLVTVTALPKSPQMVVLSVDEDKKTVNTVWFVSGNVFQEGSFPAAALDRAEAKKPPQKKRLKNAGPKGNR